MILQSPITFCWSGGAYEEAVQNPAIRRFGTCAFALANLCWGSSFPRYQNNNTDCLTFGPGGVPPALSFFCLTRTV